VHETGDRKDGKATAHVGKQYLGGIGKIDNGVVSVSSLWVEERVYYPLELEPYTPAHNFVGGKADPEFRTKPQIALELVERALGASLRDRHLFQGCGLGHPLRRASEVQGKA
jgi:SRSO17 transposase